MRSLTATLLPMMLLGMQTSCAIAKPAVVGSGVNKTETREVQPFDKLAVGGAFDVVVKVGQPQSVVITADDNIIGLIDTKVVNGELKVDSEESLKPKTKMRIEIVVPSLKSAGLAGSGDVQIDGVKEQKLELSIAGSGDVRATGSVESLETSIAGSGALKLEDLDAKSAKVDIAGSGDVQLRVSDALAVSIAGSGDVTYIGSPATIKRSIAGSGKIKQKQMQ